MKKTRANKKPDPPPDCEELCCPDDPCLLLLRDAAIAEREAILFYLEAAAMLCGDLQQLFLDTAADEMEHFVIIMRRIACLDPVQAEALDEVGLDSLLPRRAMLPKWATGWQPACAVSPPVETEADMTAVCLLTKALTSEFAAINTYQKAMTKTEDDFCGRLFCRLMNDEKEHVASFVAALYCQTGEPPPEEFTDDRDP